RRDRARPAGRRAGPRTLDPVGYAAPQHTLRAGACHGDRKGLTTAERRRDSGSTADVPVQKLAGFGVATRELPPARPTKRRAIAIRVNVGVVTSTWRLGRNPAEPHACPSWQGLAPWRSSSEF